ncbi:MAG: hypothetical protein A2720_00080 [Candidatus Doudnabacteria bacterium RIFCSPHIGHO2_01_FULL_46_24]|uniref:Uncharacterized protein n=1 Tax=Candidatus Doudnabacteria bacterium RIFCSPHIGHO2_01_FULL_46_24 TaxID=1817825 RepID=A0A1F5NVR6_9BACT|nr:MAG: hypothetical protein A2720_00080 [Candidatus Doudnabacteria bacterium RIFCSPHIGHO2_01_FULL_46_24]
MKYIKLFMIAAALGLLVWFRIVPAILPPAEAGVRAINSLADSHEKIRAREDKAEVAPLVGGDDRNFGAGLKEFGSKDHLRQVDRQAALDRQNGAMPIAPDPYAFIQATNLHPQGCVPFSEPVVIYETSGYISYPRYSEHAMHPADNPFNPNPNYEGRGLSSPYGVPAPPLLGKVNTVLPYPDYQRHLALLVRATEKGVSSGWLPLLPKVGQTAAMLDPASWGRHGCLEFKVNQEPRLHGEITGGYQFKYIAADKYVGVQN